MGVCSSTQNTGTLEADGMKEKAKAKVIHVDGQIQELQQPMKASNITSQNPGCFLCNSESIFIGSCVPRLPEEELLQPGQIYFLMPISCAHTPMSLADLCALAIKASSGMGKDRPSLSDDFGTILCKPNGGRRGGGCERVHLV